MWQQKIWAEGETQFYIQAKTSSTLEKEGSSTSATGKCDCLCS